MRRITELDSIRGVAAIVIVVFHMRFVDAYPALGSAVDLFFVLSGYLITTIILTECRAQGFFSNFYVRRMLRIWPIYLLALLACIAVNPLLDRPEPVDGFWHYFTYVQNIPAYWGSVTPPFSRLFLHTWTLAIEEQFYLVWPIVVVTLGRNRLKWAVFPLFIVPVILRSRGYSPHLLFTRCDGLALGAWLADLLFDRDRVEAKRQRYQRTFIAVALIALISRQWIGPLVTRLDPVPGGFWAVWNFALNNAELSLIYTSLVGLVLLHQGSPKLAWLRRPRPVHLGTISYGIYLYHPFVLVFMPMVLRGLGIKGSPWMDVLKLAVCIGLAEVSWRLIELPILRLKERFRYKSNLFSELRGPHSAPAPAFDVSRSASE